jgi:hypothetical protein
MRYTDFILRKNLNRERNKNAIAVIQFERAAILLRQCPKKRKNPAGLLSYTSIIHNTLLAPKKSAVEYIKSEGENFQDFRNYFEAEAF